MGSDELTLSEFLAGLLVTGQWPQDPVSPVGWEILAGSARNEGVACALFERVSWQGTSSPVAASLHRALAGEARRAAALEILNRIELERVLSGLVAAGQRFMLFKGTPLAYTLYPNPAFRTRCDTDVLVPPDAVAGFVESMRALGYEEQTSIGGAIVSRQKSLVYRDATGNAHVFDLHWSISNRPGLADRIAFEELWAHRRAVMALGSGIYAPDDVYALLLSCLHLAGHHPGEEKLIWLYDIHLLAQVLSREDRSRFLALCRQKGIVDPCRSVLTLAAARLPSPELDDLSAKLGGKEARTPPRRMQPTRLRLLCEDLHAMSGWRARLLLLKEHAFPGMDYMRARYGVRHRCLLPYYYAKRALKGAGGWLRRP